MTVEIITHCYGPFYATLLAEQLRTIGDSWATVLYWKEEGHLLHDAIDEWEFKYPVKWWPLDKPELLNRSIGRNMAAKDSTADWLWFTDADYLFGEGCLESLVRLDPHSACMYYPRAVWRPDADEYFDDGLAIDDMNWTPHRVKKAIGGCQIVPGHIARQYGYLDQEPWRLKPATGDRFENTHGDSHVRRYLAAKTAGLPILPADIPNVRRLRHRIPETSARSHLLPMEA